jgi:hypothetical protein
MPMLLFLFSCTSPDPGKESAGAPDSTAPLADPFQQPELDDGGLNNVAENALDLLDGGSLEGACDAWRAQPDSRELALRCGKWMYFYEDFGVAGVPPALVDLLLSGFQAEVGPGFSSYGLILDPSSEKGYPLGLVEGENGAVLTCASCHMGRLPDGRLAVGAANYDFDYGGLNLAFAVFPMAAMSSVSGMEVSPEAQAEVQPLLDHLQSDISLQVTLFTTMMGLITTEIPEFSPENQTHYAQWPTGTMDFLIQPLPIDDNVHTVSKISPLWGIPTAAEIEATGMKHAMLGWTGNTTSTRHFVALFDALGGGDGASWAPEDLEPLALYVESLRAPTPPSGDAAAVERGHNVFVSDGCIGCHQGPRGSGLDLYTYEEIGTDPAMAAWFDADMDGDPCCEVDLSEDPVTHALKSPRLVGLWASRRFLHNGAVSSLQELLCVDGPRAVQGLPALSTAGHLYGCDSLTAAQKADLIAYLQAH